MVEKAILCIDDEKIILTSLKSQLKKLFGDDYLYETAENAFDALDILDELIAEQIKVLVVVSDWLMPEMKGDELLMHVHNKFPGITKILLTGQADQDSINKLYSSVNLHKCIQKPWDEEELYHSLRTGLIMAEAIA